MIWVVACILSLVGDTGGQRSDLSLSGTVQMGAAIASSFFNPESAKFSGFLSEITQAAGISQKEQGSKFILVLLRLMGVDSGKVKDFAFEGIISLVHLLSQTILKESANDRMGRTSLRNSLLRFIISQPQVAGLLKEMQDPMLVDELLKELMKKRGNSEENAECIRLLICKIHPFVRGMQLSLKFFMKREGIRAPGDDGVCPVGGEEESCREGLEDAAWEKESLENRMYFFLPGIGEVTAHGDKCDQLFPNCEY